MCTFELLFNLIMPYTVYGCEYFYYLLNHRFILFCQLMIYRPVVSALTIFSIVLEVDPTH